MPNYSYGNRTLRAVQMNDRLWFLLEDISAMTGVTYKGQDLRRAGFRPDVDYVRVNISEIPDVGNTHIKGNGPRILVSDGCLFDVIARGRTELSRDFRYWMRDELWPALIHDGFYASSEGSILQETVDQVVLLTAEVTVLRAMTELGPDATLGDLTGWAG